MPAPFLETPPNPVDESKPAKLRSTRFGELDEHELIRLLDTLDDERSKARFRESVYISLFIYVIIGWFVLYGPRVLFHQPRIVSPFDVLKQREMTNLETPSDIAKHLRPAPKAPKTPAVRPQIDQKTLEAMRKAAAAKPTPAPPAPEPKAATTPPALAQPTPPLVQRPTPPAPPTAAVIPEAPKPSPTFGGNRSAGSSIQDAIQGAAKNRGAGGDYSDNITPTRVGVGTGVDILSDTMGVNFDPYLKKIMRQIYNTWIPLIPEEARPPLNKQGITQIRFTILPDGHIGGMVLEGSTHDDALNRAAWGSITGVGQFPALPKEFHGPKLELRIHYLVNQKQE
jgi:outer membrane biosynthesis protein TonB